MAAPRWKQAIENALAKNKKANVVQLASNDILTPYPQVRCIIFRAFMSPEGAPQLPLFISTTDVRSPKVSQLVESPLVQLSWWIADTDEQFRISGRACVLPPPSNPLINHFKQMAAERDGALSKLEDEGFDWEAKRKEIFESMSPFMKASWCRPVPGSYLADGHDVAKEWPKRVDAEGIDTDPDKRKIWDEALENFGLLIVEPLEVDHVQLSPDKRTRFWVGKAGWEEEALVP